MMTYQTLLPFATRSLGPFYTVSRDINRALHACASMGAPGGAFTPRLDLLENQDGFTIIAELPGFDAADVNVDVQDNTVILSGDKKAAALADGVKQHIAERSAGSFRRSFELPVDIDADAVTASFKNGVLTIDLPRVPVSQPKVKKVAVQTV